MEGETGHKGTAGGPELRGIEGPGAEAWSNAALARRYGVAERTVKRWKSLGKKAGDRTPVEDPVAMVEWWGRNMVWRVPAEVLAAADKEARRSQERLLEAARAAGRAVASKQLAPVDECLPVEWDDAEGVADLGLSTMRKVVAIRSKALADAYRAGDDTAVQSAERRHQQALSTLRQLEKTQAELSAKIGALVPAEEVARGVKGLVSRLATAFFSGLQRAAERARNEAHLDCRLIAAEERDRTFRVVKGTQIAGVDAAA